MWLELLKLEAQIKQSNSPWVWAVVVNIIALIQFCGKFYHHIFLGDFITTGMIVSLIISASFTAASYIIHRLEQKTQLRGVQTGNELIQDSQYFSFINEIYGGPPEDGIGGYKISGNIIDCSEIRKSIATTTEGGKGGLLGGGGQKVQTTSYHQDIMISIGRGPLDVLQITRIDSTGTNIIYNAVPTLPTGIINPDIPQEDPQDPYFLPQPVLDVNFGTRYNGNPFTTPEGAVQAPVIANGIGITIYPGNEDQLPDPLFEAINGGPGSTPAYRGQCIVVLNDVDVSGGLPTYWFLVGHQTLKTVGDIATSRALRTGLQVGDIDCSSISRIPVRGFLINQQQAPRTDMELLGQVYDCVFSEGFKGKVTGIPIPEDISAVLEARDIGWTSDASAVPTSDPTSAQNISAQEKDSTDLFRELDMSFIDPANKYESGIAIALRQITDSQGVNTNQSIQITFTQPEAQSVADRMLQKSWRDSGSWTFTTYHKFAWVEPSSKIKIVFDNEDKIVRVQQITGAVPGILTFNVSPAEGVLIPSIFAKFVDYNPSGAGFPGRTVLSLIDIPPINSQQDTPGIMAAVAPRDITVAEWVSANLFVDKGAGFQFMTNFDTAATMGIVVSSSFPDVPSGYSPEDWDDVSTITVDLYDGALQTLNDEQVLDGDNLFIIGNELVGVAVWTRDVSGSNRWNGSHMQRQMRKTLSSGHGFNERFILLNNAVKFIRLDVNELDIERTYRCVTIGRGSSERLEDAADVLFTWTGETLPNPAFGIIDMAVPTVTQAPSVTLLDGTHAWVVYTPLPDAHWSSPQSLEIRVRTTSNVLVRNVPGNIGGVNTIGQTIADANIDYRWRNQYRGNGSDGWSQYSPITVAAGSGNGVQPPADSGSGSPNINPHDVGIPRGPIIPGNPDFGY